LEEICRILGDEGYDINIETNGAVPLFRHRPKGVFYTMDYKCTGSGVRKYMRTENFRDLTQDDVLKFVVSDRRDLDDMKYILDTYFPGDGPKFYVSPVWGRIEPVELVDYVKAHGLDRVCVQVQLHKIIWSPTKRGV
jgi:hypothetical protein